MSDLRTAIRFFDRYTADEAPLMAALVEAAKAYADLLDVVEVGGRIIAETPCEHGQTEQHSTCGHDVGCRWWCADEEGESCAGYGQRRVVLGDDT